MVHGRESCSAIAVLPVHEPGVEPGDAALAILQFALQVLDAIHVALGLLQDALQPPGQGVPLRRTEGQVSLELSPLVPLIGIRGSRFGSVLAG